MMVTLCVIWCRRWAIFVQFEMYLRVTAEVLRARFWWVERGKGGGTQWDGERKGKKRVYFWCQCGRVFVHLIVADLRCQSSSFGTASNGVMASRWILGIAL